MKGFSQQLLELLGVEVDMVLLVVAASDVDVPALRDGVVVVLFGPMVANLVVAFYLAVVTVVVVSYQHAVVQVQAPQA